MSSTGYTVRIAPAPDGSGSGNRVPDLSPREAWERWLGRLRSTKADSTVSSYHYRTKHFIEFLEREGITPVRQLGGWHLDTYEIERREEGLTPLSLNKELGTVRQLVAYWERIGLVEDGLAEKVDPPDVPRDAHVDETLLEPGRAQDLLDYYDADPEARYTRSHALLALAWYTFGRLGALRALDLEDYSSEDGYVQFIHRPREETPLKNGVEGERRVLLPDRAVDVVDGYLEHERHDVFDDYGRRPLLASEVGRPKQNTVRTWMYLATVPCLHTACPHGNEPETCEFLSYSNASQCPSSRSPHQVRTGAITWAINRGVSLDDVSHRANTSVRVLKRHYDQPSKEEELTQRQRPYLDQLSFDDDGDAGGENGGGSA